MDEKSLRVAVTLTRRTFMGAIALGGAALVVPAGALLLQAERAGGHSSPVVSFHMDQPYLDMTGTAIPYYPPPGVRSGDAAARLSEEVFRSMLL
jgi:hypothetical protein